MASALRSPLLAYNLYERGDPRLLSWLQLAGVVREIATDTCLIEEGQLATGMFIVESGALSVRTSSSAGDSLNLAELGPGSFVGEMSWLEGRPAVARVDALAGSRILHISATALDEMRSGRYAVAPLLYQAIGTKLSLQIQSQNAWIHRFSTSELEPLRKVLVLFAELEEADVDWLRRLGRLQRLPPGGVLLNEGDPVPGLYLLLAGEARIQVTSQGALRTVGSSRRGELLGEMTLLDTSVSGATARVDTESGMELLRIEKSDLLQALEADSHRATRFWRGLARMLSQRSRDQLLDRGFADASRQAEVDRDSDEIDLNQLSAISTAGARFDWLCRQFQNQEG